MSLPSIARVRQHPEMPGVVDLAGTIRDRITSSGLRHRVPVGGSIAVGVGSRGIKTIRTLVAATITTLQDMGYRPFIVAAMGSHGGATADGQRALLASYGITAESMGVPVRTDMETQVVGTSPIGLPIHFDANALAADGIVLINRVKPHTDFRAPFESGILKMMVIGLGKQQGAAQIHKLGVRGLTEVMPAVGRLLIEQTPFALGLAIVENALEWPAEIAALEPETLMEREPILLQRAFGLMGRLPFDQIDVLVVGEIGKNYSGAGMDPNVIGRLLMETQQEPARPRVTRLVALDVSPESHGNIVGVGFADLVTRRLVDQLDPVPFRINTLTANFLERSRIPITLDSDAQVLDAAIQTCWRVDPAEVRMVFCPNTLELDTLWITRPLESEVSNNPELTLDSPYQPIPLDASGHLDQCGLFPECTRSRRQVGHGAPSG